MYLTDRATYIICMTDDHCACVCVRICVCVCVHACDSVAHAMQCWHSYWRRLGATNCRTAETEEAPVVWTPAKNARPSTTETTSTWSVCMYIECIADADSLAKLLHHPLWNMVRKRVAVGNIHHITQYTVPQMNACMHQAGPIRQHIRTSLLSSQNAQVHTQALCIPSYSPKIR